MSNGSIPSFPVSKQFGKGDLVGDRYRLVKQIGAGAMGTVWVAHNEVLDVDMAVKVLRVDSRKADASRLYKRLLREAQAAARLGHPSIVRVFDFGQTEDRAPYIAMELLSGESLAELLARKPKMDVVPAVQLLLPIIDAMATAHGRGIVHRDLKPENIFLAKDEFGRVTPKIVDFGVARFIEAGRSLTRSGALLGTPDYMAPEQARGEPGIDQRVDIWAVCIVLYELIVGRRPFARDATNYLAVLRAIVHDMVPSTLSVGVGDQGLWKIIERGLKKRKSDRWETMRSLGQALALWLYERGVREDAMGASLKTTWLQAGLDGVKIETPSMLPPKPDEQDGLGDTDRPAAKDPSSPPPPPSSRRGRNAAATAAATGKAGRTESESPMPPPVTGAPTTPPSGSRAGPRSRILSGTVAALAIAAAVAAFAVLRGETRSYRASLSPESPVTTEPLAAGPGAPQGDVLAPGTGTEPILEPGTPPPTAATSLAAPSFTTSTTAAPQTSSPTRRATSSRTTSTRPARRVTHKASLPSSRTYDFGF